MDVAEAAAGRPVSARLRTAVMEALAVEPRERPRTIEEWRAMLDVTQGPPWWRKWPFLA